MCMWLNFLIISMKEMTFKVAAPSHVFQCLFFKIALHLDKPENQKIFGWTKTIVSQKFHELR